MKYLNIVLLSLSMLSISRVTYSFKRLLTSSVKIAGQNSQQKISNGRCSSTKIWSAHLSNDIMTSLRQRVQEVNDMSGINSVQTSFMPFIFNGATYGYVSLNFADQLANYPETFTILKKSDDSRVIELTPELCKMNLVDRSAAVGKVTEDLRKQKIITGWFISERAEMQAADSIHQQLELCGL